LGVGVVVGVALAALLTTGCGSSPGGTSASPFEGRWHGILPRVLQGVDLAVDVDARPTVNAPDVYVGTISTNAPRCFTAGMLGGTDSNGTIMAYAAGSGSATQGSSITITGQLDGRAIRGLFSMTSDADGCTVEPTAISLHRE
jgi:hypothetical protein